MYFREQVQDELREIFEAQYTAVVTDALKSGDSVQFIDFDTFEVRERAACTGRNSHTGKAIEIAAAKVPAFKRGKALKDAIR